MTAFVRALVQLPRNVNCRNHFLWLEDRVPTALHDLTNHLKANYGFLRYDSPWVEPSKTSENRTSATLSTTLESLTRKRIGMI